MQAVSFKIAEQLDRHFNLHDIGPITPRVNKIDALWSKLHRRIFHVRGNFHQFSVKTLEATANQLEGLVDCHTDAIFFRSVTRWIMCRPAVPYFVHTDVAFHTFFHNTFAPSEFRASDLERIWDEERRFLEGASAVFFESDWGLQKARSAYQLTGDHYIALKNGGGIDPPAQDIWDGTSLRLISIAKHFKQKGGDITLEAFKILKPQYPQLQWHIIGGPPEGDGDTIDGLHYEGFLHTDIPAELVRFRNLLAGAFLLVHPTREDTNPLVLVEAAYFGCPSISVNDFAIPELVSNTETGILLERPVTAAAIANAIEALIVDRDRYAKMRQKARQRAVQQFQWNAIGDEMATSIDLALTQETS